MNTSKIMCLIFSAGMAFSCGSADHKQEIVSNESAPSGTALPEMPELSSDSVSSNPSFSNSASGNGIRSVDKTLFMRSADLRFRVKDVVKGTDQIENIVGNQGGYVSFTDLKTTTEEVNSHTVSKDSVLEVTRYNVTNHMSLRVPNVRLDTTLKQIASIVTFLDHRLIRADDVSLQKAAAAIQIARSNRQQERIAGALDKKGRKLRDMETSEEVLESKESLEDESRIAMLGLDEKVAFSTIEIDMYQSPVIEKVLKAGPVSIDEFEPGFLEKMKESLSFGWDVVLAFVLFLSRLWAFALLAVGLYFILRKYKPKVA
jgi:hypothetical protein